MPDNHIIVYYNPSMNEIRVEDEYPGNDRERYFEALAGQNCAIIGCWGKWDFIVHNWGKYQVYEAIKEYETAVFSSTVREITKESLIDLFEK